MKTQTYESVGSYLRIVKLDYASGKSRYVIQIKDKKWLVQFIRAILFGRKMFGWDYFDKSKDEWGQLKFPSYNSFEEAKKTVDEFIADKNEIEEFKKDRTIIKKTIM